ncbi:MAG: glutamate racemase [Alphaproteobacteria bacterium]
MKLGVFDSGLGGLLIAKAIRQHIPNIDLLYFGDTLHLPYGNRSHSAIYEYSKRAIEFMFQEGCQLIIVACNTVSASALRQLQQEYLPNSPYKDRRLLGVVVPTLECAIDLGYKRLGLIATNYTVQSNIFEEELTKIDEEIRIIQSNTPLLVPLIENSGQVWIPSVLEHYLTPLMQKKIECLILGCTHYPFLKDQIQKIIGKDIHIIAQDDIIPNKLSDYLRRHPEIANQIKDDGQSTFLVSDLTDGYKNAAQKIYAADIEIEKVEFIATTHCYHRR